MAITVKSEALAKLVAERKERISDLDKSIRANLEKFAETVALNVISSLSISTFSTIQGTVEVRYFNKDKTLYAGVFNNHETNIHIGYAVELEGLDYWIPCSLDGQPEKAAMFTSDGDSIKIPFEEMIFQFPLE